MFCSQQGADRRRRQFIGFDSLFHLPMQPTLARITPAERAVHAEASAAAAGPAGESLGPPGTTSSGVVWLGQEAPCHRLLLNNPHLASFFAPTAHYRSAARSLLKKLLRAAPTHQNNTPSVGAQVVEMHLYRGNPIPGFPLSPSAPHSTAQMALLLSHIASLGYGIAARDDNTQTQDVGCCTELTFLRVEVAGWGHGGVGGMRGRPLVQESRGWGEGLVEWWRG